MNVEVWGRLWCRQVWLTCWISWSTMAGQLMSDEKRDMDSGAPKEDKQSIASIATDMRSLDAVAKAQL